MPALLFWPVCEMGGPCGSYRALVAGGRGGQADADICRVRDGCLREAGLVRYILWLGPHSVTAAAYIGWSVVGGLFNAPGPL